MNQFAIFKEKLAKAVELAEANPTPTIQQISNYKALLRNGITNGQYRIVIQAYNSVLNTIAYQKSKTNKSNHL